MNVLTYAIIAYFALVNLIIFVLFGMDKWKATDKKRRIRESTLLKRTAAGGCIGAIAGMEIFRHKTIKGAFLWKFRLIVVGWIGLVIGLLIWKG